MTASFTRKISALALAGAAALSLTFSTGTAQAGEREAWIVGGSIVGAALLGGIISNHGPRYVEEAPVRRCWKERRVVDYDDYDNPIIRRVRVCSR
jgi:hypothetical protein